MFGVRAMNKRVLVLVPLLLAGCSKTPVATSYCRAISSAEPSRELAVSDVYVYGTLEHGSVFISPSCIRPLYTFYSFQDAVSPAVGAVDRIKEFNKSVYNSPGRASGLFRLKAVVNVYPDSKLVELYDIVEFKEVEVDEAQPIFELLRESRG